MLQRDRVVRCIGDHGVGSLDVKRCRWHGSDISEWLVAESVDGAKFDGLTWPKLGRMPHPFANVHPEPNDL